MTADTIASWWSGAYGLFAFASFVFREKRKLGQEGGVNAFTAALAFISGLKLSPTFSPIFPGERLVDGVIVVAFALAVLIFRHERLKASTGSIIALFPFGVALLWEASGLSVDVSIALWFATLGALLLCAIADVRDIAYQLRSRKNKGNKKPRQTNLPARSLPQADQ